MAPLTQFVFQQFRLSRNFSAKLSTTTTPTPPPPPPPPPPPFQPLSKTSDGPSLTLTLIFNNRPSAQSYDSNNSYLCGVFNFKWVNDLRVIANFTEESLLTTELQENKTKKLK